MGRAPCCDKANVKRGPWSPEEDASLKNYLTKHGTGGNWISLPQRADLKRCGKSCRLRWLNYLRPDIKHGAFSQEEDNIIISLYNKMGSRWSVIAANLAGRTDNDVKNHWNTKLKKRLFGSHSHTFNPKIKNLTFTNDIISHLNYNPPTSSSTPTPSSSPPPTYLDHNNTTNNNIISPNYSNYSANLDHNHHHQFYVTIPSFSDLLTECTTNSNYNHLSTLDPLNSNVYSQIIPTPYPFHQFADSSAPVYAPQNENPSMASTSTGIYESTSNVDDDKFLSELGFGFFQEVVMNSTSNNYGDQEDIKPQGLGQSVTNY